NVLTQGIKAPPPAVSASSSAPAFVSSSSVAPVQEMREERVRMIKLRQTIARRLKDAQNTAAMLTTFNEVDMSAVMDLRKRYKDLF
uniref:2-oxo acid dehydrogenase subunit E2 n=1 Tax=Bartonella vinsonii TaxID=33047 RepID=UPI001F172C89